MNFYETSLGNVMKLANVSNMIKAYLILTIVVESCQRMGWYSNFIDDKWL